MTKIQDTRFETGSRKCEFEWTDGWGDHECYRGRHQDGAHRCYCDAETYVVMPKLTDVAVVGTSETDRMLPDFLDGKIRARESYEIRTPSRTRHLVPALDGVIPRVTETLPPASPGFLRYLAEQYPVAVYGWLHSIPILGKIEDEERQEAIGYRVLVRVVSTGMRAVGAVRL